MSQPQRTVLIVDDSPEDSELYRQYLLQDREYEYNFVIAESGQAGLELWQRDKPDFVLLDHGLPDLDGVEFLRELQTLTRQSFLPVIVVTGVGNEAIAVQAMKAGAQNYLVKGKFTAHDLQFTVNSAIENLQLRTRVQQSIEKERLFAQIIAQINKSQNFNEIMQTTVSHVRQFLQTDRVVVFQLYSDCSGSVVAESVEAPWQSILGFNIFDPCLANDYVERYRQGLINLDPTAVEDYIERYCQGLVTVKTDIYDGTIDPCHVELLAQFQVRANLVVPIMHNNYFWGILIVHHCREPRQWQQLEIDLLQELASHLSVALGKAEALRQLQNELAERKQIEEELRESEARYRYLAEAIPHLVWTCNVQGNCEYVNQRLCKYTGLTFEEALGFGWLSCVPPDEIQSTREVWETAVSKGTFYRQEHRLRRNSDGTYRWHLILGLPLKDEQGRVVKWFGTCTDIHDQKELEIERDRVLELEQIARSEAERANRIKDEFLAILSHELRSPLNPILGWTKLLQTRKMDENKTSEALATIERNAKLQTQLIDDLLDIARILRGKLNLNPDPVNLTFVIEAAIDTVRTAAVAKSILIHPVLRNIGQVSGDAVRLQQVFWNLLSNAIKFTPNGGRVDITLERLGDQAQVTVTDTGKGISPDFLPHIFESFRQEDVSITRKYGGLGLGLAIVRHITEAHGGTAGVDSPGVDQGATFTVTLPLLNIEPDSDRLEELSAEELNLTGIKVLTIDDEPDSREFLTVLLAYYGAQVMTVATSTEFLAALESFQPDVLVSDIGMPEVDGYTLLRQVRSLPPEHGGQIPAIALTAYAGEINQQQALAAGFQSHLSKPIEPALLVQAVIKLTSSAS